MWFGTWQVVHSLSNKADQLESLVSTYVVCERLSVMLRQILEHWDLTSRTPQPPLPHQCRLEYVETNRCIPQGYHLVCVDVKQT